MDPVSTIEGGVTFVDQDDVDTDQIIPAQFMKRVERTGFGEFLFHEWRGQREPAKPAISSQGENFGGGSGRTTHHGLRQLHSATSAVRRLHNNC